MAEAADTKFTVIPMCESHWESVRRVYQAGIDSGHATFASVPPADRTGREAGA